MNTIFSNFSKDVDLSIFRESNKDPKTPLRRHYLSLVGLLEYVDILNGNLPGRALPDGMTIDDVKRMVSHAISDLDTKKAISTDGSLPEHEYIDLGLPSGILWATEHIKDANGNILCFAWGETHGYTENQIGRGEGKRYFDEESYELGQYEWYKESDWVIKKYNQNDGLTVLEPKDDAATVNWGEEWKMPTNEQFEELIANSEFEWTEVDGVPGAKFTSIVEGYTDRFLFFPATGFSRFGGVRGADSRVCCWSGSLSEWEVNNAQSISLDINDQYTNGSFRETGRSVRPVRARVNKGMQGDDGSLHEHDYIDLGLPSGTLWATESIKDTDGNDLYFAWGETTGYTVEQIGEEEGKKSFDQDDYELGQYDWYDKTRYVMKKYNETDGLTVLEPKDDAARVNWGEEWRMPTWEQTRELIANIKKEWVKIDGVYGYKLTSTVEGYTDKFLFFPQVEGVVNCWLSSLEDGRDFRRAWCFAPDNSNPPAYGFWREMCAPVRPIRTQVRENAQDTENTQGSEGIQGSENAQGSEGTQGA